MARTSGSTKAGGVAAMLVTVAVWAAFAVSVRGIGASTLTSADVSLLRFAVPALVLALRIPRTLRALRGQNPWTLAAVAGGAGAPFLLTASLGGAMTSASLVGLVIPGTVPLFVTIICALVWRERITRRQAVAVTAIVSGVAVAVVGSTSEVSAGIGVLLVAGLLWSVYTLGLRRTSLGPDGAALVLCIPSALAVAVGILFGWLPSRLAAGTAAPGDILSFGLVQGLGVGVIAGLCYAYAVRRLGPQPAAALGALSPVVTMLLAVPVFGEVPHVAGLTAMTIIVTGVLAFTLAPPRQAAARPGRPRPVSLSDSTPTLESAS